MQTVTHIWMYLLANERQSFERSDKYGYVRIVIGTLDYADPDLCSYRSTGERTLDYANRDSYRYDSTGERTSEF
jgi:hypothetical protein